jgi:hypothetical protein
MVLVKDMSEFDAEILLKDFTVVTSQNFHFEM